MISQKLIILAVIVIAILGVVVLYQSQSMTLDQIIKNKDCTALSKWEEEHMFDDNLNISSEQLSAAMKLAMECVGKALKNMSGNSDSASTYINNQKRLDKIFETDDCDAMKELREKRDLMSLGVTTSYHSSEIVDFTYNCENNINAQK